MVSILIPMYNSAEFIGTALQSALGQTYADIEIVCVDDGSTDDTLAVVRRFAETDGRIRLLCHERNMGVAAGRKTLVTEARGDIIMFLDSDDTLCPDACKTVVDAMQSTGADVLQFGAGFVGAESWDEPRIKNLAESFVPKYKSISTSNATLVDSCFLGKSFNAILWNKAYRTEIVKKAFGFYDPDRRMALGEDYMFSFMMLAFAREFRAIDDVLYTYRLDSGISTKEYSRNTVTLDRIALFNGLGTALDILERFIDETELRPQLEGSLRALREEFYSSIAYIIICCLNNKLFDSAIRKLLESWPPRDIIAALELRGSCYGNQEDCAKIKRRVMAALEGKNTYTFKRRIADLLGK